MPSLPSGTNTGKQGQRGRDQNRETSQLVILGVRVGSTPSTQYPCLEAASHTHPCSSADEIFPINRFSSVCLQCGKSHNSNTDGFWSALRSAMSDLITQSTRVLRGARQLLGAPTEPSHVVENPSGQNCRTADRMQTAHSAPAVHP